MKTATVLINTFAEKFEYLETAIKSYVSQIGVNLQIIIATVDDDPNLPYLKRWKGIDLNVIPRKDHPGRSPRGSFYQINSSLRLVKGEWFCFASSNDEAYPFKIFSEIQAAITQGKKICYSNYNLINERGEIQSTLKFSEYNREQHQAGNFVNDCSIIHKSLLDKYGPFRSDEFNNYAFWDFWLRVYEGEGNVFALNEKPTWGYRQLETSMHIQRRNNPSLMKQFNDDRIKMLSTHGINKTA